MKIITHSLRRVVQRRVVTRRLRQREHARRIADERLFVRRLGWHARVVYPECFSDPKSSRLAHHTDRIVMGVVAGLVVYCLITFH